MEYKIGQIITSNEGVEIEKSVIRRKGNYSERK